MGRSLPRAHEDDDSALRKRRSQIFKSFYQGYYEWRSLRDTGLTIEEVLTSPDGEEIYMPDLLTGYPYLPLRQQQSFELICLQSYTEAAATREIYGPDEAEDADEASENDDTSDSPVRKKKRSSTVVQQYAQQALERMVTAYDQKQDGTWNPAEVMKTRKLNGRTHHVNVSALGNGLEFGSPGRRNVGPASGHVPHDRREDRDAHRDPDAVEVGS